MILISGATGTNGRVIVERLAAAGHTVRAMVRDANRARDLAAPNVELVEADYAHPASLARALSGVRAALQLTPVDAHQVEWATAFIDAARAHGNIRIVRFSGMGANVNAGNEIMRLHGRADAYLKQSGLPWVILQANSFHQNIFYSIASIRSQGAFYLPLGDAAQSTIDVRDIADVAVRALTEEGHEGQVYELSGPRALTFGEVASILSEVTGRDIHYVAVSRDAAVDGMKQAGIPPWNAEALGDLYADFASGQYARVTSTVQQVTGHAPIDFRVFAQENRDAFQA